MHSYLRSLIMDIELTGDLGRDAFAFLGHHGCPHTAAHCAAVAVEAERVATIVGSDPGQAKDAGWLHDVSAVFPAAERVSIAQALGIPLLAEEVAFPLIVHQKLSAVLARDIFGVSNPAIVSAVGCHTTLKANATTLDKVVFVADKLAWDQPGIAPYHEDLSSALRHSIDAAALVYLRYMWNQRATLPVLHPWLAEAYQQLSARVCGKCGPAPLRWLPG